MNPLKTITLIISIITMSLNTNAQVNCQDFDIVLSSSNLAPQADGYFYTCPNDTLQLTVQGIYLNNNISYNQSDATTDFIWFSFGTEADSNLPTFEVSYTEAGIYPILCQATDANGCTNSTDLIFYVIVSGPSLMELTSSLPDETYCLGDSITLFANSSFDSLETISVDTISFTYTNDSLLYIPDGTGQIFEVDIDVPEYMDNPNLQLEDLVVCVDMEHSFLGDLEIILTCPDGNSIILHDFSNFSGGGYYLGQPVDNNAGPVPGITDTYCWTTDATNGTWLQSAGLVVNQTLPSDNYSPYQALNGLYNCNKSGTWTLSIEDFWGIDNGYLSSWSLGFIMNDSIVFDNLNYDTISYVTQVVNQYWELPDGSQVNSNQIDIEIEAPIYTYHIEDQSGCDITFDFVMSFADDTTCGQTCIPYPSTDTSFNICLGDTLIFEGVELTNSGNYSILPENLSLYCNTPINVTVSIETFFYNLNITPSTSGQNNGAITISPSPFVTLSLIEDSMEVSMIDSLASGTYIVEVYNGNCSLFDTVFVPNNCIPYPNIDTSFTLCLGDTITYEGVDITSPGNYSINPEDLTYYCDTLINVTVMGDTLDYNLNIIPSLAGANDGSITVLTPGYFIINDTANVIMLDSLASGNYQIEISDGNCSQMDTVFVDEYLLLMATVMVDENFVSTSTYSATVTISGGWGDYLIEWSTGQTGSDITIYNLAPGFYNVKVTDDLGNEIIVYFEVEDTTTTYDPSIFRTAKIYPNPTSNVLNIEYVFHQSVDYSLSFYDMLGKEIFNKNGKDQEIMITQDLSHLTSGVYLMNISIDGESWVEKIIVE